MVAIKLAWDKADLVQNKNHEEFMNLVMFIRKIAAATLVLGLAFSYSTHARETSISQAGVDSYAVGSSAPILKVWAYLRNTCQTGPNVVVRKMKQIEGTVVAELAIEAPVANPQAMCASVLSDIFEMNVDLRTLDLPVNQPVEIFFDGQPSTMIQIHEHVTQTPAGSLRQAN